MISSVTFNNREIVIEILCGDRLKIPKSLQNAISKSFKEYLVEETLDKSYICKRYLLHCIPNITKANNRQTSVMFYIRFGNRTKGWMRVYGWRNY